MYRQLDNLCEQTYVSVSAKQQGSRPYLRLPTITDQKPQGGPAIGLLSAWRRFPHVAWLTVAVDMPCVDAGVLKMLVESRRSGAVATAFQHADGTFEPLCTIWEPAAAPVLAARLASGDASLRRSLVAAEVRALTPPSSTALVSVNSPEEFDAIRPKLLDR
jgi:molybdopterin-guanine dinucleotide biosynthesis protein A